MFWGGSSGGLELRRSGDGSHHLRGTFPYNRPAVLSDGGRTGRARKEVFSPGAFRLPDEVYLLVGHDFGHPVASTRTSTLTFTDTPEALMFEARITPEIANTQHGRDVLALIGAGLTVGISPGFRVPPEGEAVTQDGDAILRTITAADLHELSIVTRPAYPEAQIEARNWTPDNIVATCPDVHPLNRWRL